MAYVDGYLLPLPRKNRRLYQGLARKAGKIWREHGALEYRECIGEDIKPKKGMGMPFARTVKGKPSETIVFSWVVFKSRAHRDSVNAKVMKDPRMAKMMEEGPMPFDIKRMAYGGFKVLVEA
jgi:uncharacterized protein YbaA (DUF1428 family)